MKSVQQRLSALREAMKKHGVDAFVIPSADPHLQACGFSTDTRPIHA